MYRDMQASGSSRQRIKQQKDVVLEPHTTLSNMNGMRE